MHDAGQRGLRSNEMRAPTPGFPWQRVPFLPAAHLQTLRSAPSTHARYYGVGEIADAWMHGLVDNCRGSPGTGGSRGSSAQPGTTVPSGVPLRVALERRVAIKRVGEPIQGRLVDPVYVFDRVVLPAGSVVEGHIAEIGGVPARRRLTAILSGNFTPPREVRAQFDALVLSDGSRLSLRTSPSRGTAHTVRIAKQRKRREEHKSAPQGAGDGLEEMDRAAIRAFTAPGKMSRLKSTLLGMLPYHRQAWPAGTLFNGVLQEPLTGAAAKSSRSANRSPCRCPTRGPGSQRAPAHSDQFRDRPKRSAGGSGRDPTPVLDRS